MGNRRDGVETTKVPFMDWEMVRLNGGPPCFFVGADDDPNRFCARAERWEGHGHLHDFISLDSFAIKRAADDRAAFIATLRERVEVMPRTRRRENSVWLSDIRVILDEMEAEL